MRLQLTAKAGSRIIGFGLPLLFAAAALLLHVTGFSPVGILPPCAFLILTGGYRCPGCGATRMMTALFRGDLATAWYYHPLLTILVPAGLVWLLWLGLRTFRKDSRPVSLHAQSLWWLMVPAVLVLFWVVRNTAWYRQWFF